MTTYVFGSNAQMQSGSGYVLNNGDELDIRGGGTATDTIINDGGLQFVEGGLANSGLINSGGREDVFAGSSFEVVVLSGGENDVDSGGTAVGTVISNGGLETVFSGGVTTGTVVTNGGIEGFDGGVAIGALALAGGLVDLQYNGTTTGTQVESGGVEWLRTDGVASGTVVSSGGMQVVLSLGGTETVSDTLGNTTALIRDGDTLSVTYNGVLTETIQSSGGVAYTTYYDASGNVASTDSGSVADLEQFDTGTASGTTVLRGGAILLAGGAISGIHVQPGGNIVVGGFFGAGFQAQETGIVISNIFVGPGVLETVSEGGQTFGTVVSGGSETVLSGGVTSASQILAGGSAIISSGATASADQVLGGTLLFLGGTLSNATVGNGGTISVGSGSITGTRILAGGTEIILPGAKVSATTVSNGGVETLAGGTASQTMLLSGGAQFVGAGGTADQTTIAVGAIQTVYQGGNAQGSLLAGSEILSGGSAVGTTVSANALLQVSAGGVARAATILGNTTVSAGGSAAGGMVGAGGQLSIMTGGSAAGITVAAGGLETIAMGGVDSVATVAGSQVLSAGSAASATVLGGGVQTVSSGGIATSAFLDGGAQLVSSGGIVVSTSVGAGGSQTVLSGGTDSAGYVSGGAQLVLGGAASGATIVAGGTQTMSSGGTAIGGNILTGGSELILPGASTTGVNVVSAQQTISAGGSASLTTVEDGGVETVLGSASMTTLDTLGGATTTLSGISVIGGAQIVSNGGVASGTRVLHGLELVQAGGRSLSAAVAGHEIVYAGGADIGASVTGAFGIAALDLSGGTATNVQLALNGRQNVFSGGVAIGTKVGNGGGVVVSAGGTATGITVQTSGSEEINSGGRDTGATIIGDGVNPASPAYAGTPPAVQNVRSGGVASATTLHSAAFQEVRSGGSADGTIVDTFSYQDVFSGGRATSTMINSGGTVLVYSGGILSNSVIGSGGIEEILNNGSAPGATISGGALALLDAGGAGAGPITFAGSGGKLAVIPTSLPANVISGFVTGDTVEFFGLSYNSADTVSNQGDIVTVSAGGMTYELDIAGGTTFQLTSATAPTESGSVLLSEIPCYLGGTLILTERGEVAVEELATGDLVRTASGALRPIRWIGTRSYDNRFVRDDPAIMPVRIAAGALGDGLPRRDLLLSPEHALFIDDALVPAKLLLNGSTVTQAFGIPLIRYFHVELDSHDILLAEGAPAESFVDCDSRGMFANAHSFAGEAPRWAFCAPRLEHGDRLARIQRRLARRPAEVTPSRGAYGHLDTATHERCTGWAWLPSDPYAALDVELLADGGVIGRVTANHMRPDVRDAGCGHGRYGFIFDLSVPLSPFKRHEITARAVGGTPLTGSVVLDPAAELGSGGLEAVGAVLRARAATEDGAREVSGFLLEQLRHTRASRPSERPLALVLDDRLPKPDRDAGSAAVMSHMRALQSIGYRVMFVPLDRACGAPDGVECATAPLYASVEEVLLQHADAALVYVHRVAAMSLYGRLIRRACPRARLIYSVADLHHLRLGRQAAVEGSVVRVAESHRARDQELAAASLADMTLTHSSAEAGLLRRLLPGVSVAVVPWHVPEGPVPYSWRRRSGLIFAGGMAHAPNADAVRWLVSDIMPRVTALNPRIRCKVAGAGLTLADRAWLHPAIDVLGPVHDLARVYRAARVAVAPLRFGAGVKGKVLEAFAAGLPCAMTPVAAEGYALPEALHGLIAVDADAFARLVAALHADSATNLAAGDAGRAFVAETASEQKVNDALANAVASARAPRLAVQTSKSRSRK